MIMASTKESIEPLSKLVRDFNAVGAGQPLGISMKFFHMVGAFSGG